MAAVLVLSHLQKRETGRKIGLIALSLVGVTVVLALIAGFATTSARFYSEPLIAGPAAVRHVYTAHDRSASLDWLGAGVLACGISRLRNVRPRSHRQPGSLRLVAVDCRRGGASGLAMLSLALWAMRPALRSIWGVGVIAILVHAAFDYPFSRPAIGAWPILILSMAVAAQSGTNPERLTQARVYSGLTVDDFPPPKPRATPTTAPAARATMTMTFAYRCAGVGVEQRGCCWPL